MQPDWLKTQQHSSYITLSQSALAANIATFNSLGSSRSILTAVVKSNAYGHGWEKIVKMCLKQGISQFAVNSIHEALALHKRFPQSQVMIMGEIAPAFRHLAAHQNFIIVSSEITDIKEYNSLTPPPDVHLKIDTGMSRLGLLPTQEHVSALLECMRSEDISIRGIMSHFANIEDVTDLSYGQKQLQSLLVVKDAFQQAGFSDLEYHISSSAAILLIEKSHLDRMRLGISLYGIWPSRETKISASIKNRSLPTLQFVLSWYSFICFLKWLPPQTPVGYGCTFHTRRQSLIATIPVGYHEGYPRMLSNCGHVLIRGQKAPVIGRVCMNMIMADVTDIIGVSRYDKVILIGRDEYSGEEVTADELARMSQSIAYETLTNLKADIPRHII